ncbi:MAG TPA: DUF433 domain-containing protein [Gemmataceae bacterium]|jgi:uncharacterized protein (DUF433 family)
MHGFSTRSENCGIRRRSLEAESEARIEMGDVGTYVHVNENGAWWIGDTEVPLDSVMIAYDHGHSPESIQQQYPALSLEEVYGTITFYLANQAKVRDYLEKQEKLWEVERIKNEANPNPLRERLRIARTSNRVGL